MSSLGAQMTRWNGGGRNAARASLHAHDAIGVGGSGTFVFAEQMDGDFGLLQGGVDKRVRAAVVGNLFGRIGHDAVPLAAELFGDARIGGLHVGRGFGQEHGGARFGRRRRLAAAGLRLRRALFLFAFCARTQVFGGLDHAF